MRMAIVSPAFSLTRADGARIFYFLLRKSFRNSIALRAFACGHMLSIASLALADFGAFGARVIDQEARHQNQIAIILEMSEIRASERSDAQLLSARERPSRESTPKASKSLYRVRPIKNPRKSASVSANGKRSAAIRIAPIPIYPIIHNS